MNLALNEAEKSAIFAELKTDYLYIALPFFVLVLIKLFTGTWRDIFLSPDWSLAACLIFGQSTSKVSRSVVAVKIKIVERQFGWYVAKRFFLVVVSLLFYFGMTAKPCLELGIFQIFIFFLASFFHFKDGFSSLLLSREVLDNYSNPKP